ncbi:hypothetical protein GOODEAATRI_024305 [Goodea atripinnis]|uniref:HSR domain-containing protein n=1 Tax=Goodea atripinnis TaxID=208336 RepID=A0ABV0PRY1_9TELE
MYSLLSWLLEQSRSTLQAFWSNLSKDYNMDSYPKLKTLLTNLKSERDAPRFKAKNRSSGGVKASHSKKRSHEDRGTNVQHSEYHAQTSDGTGHLSLFCSILPPTAFHQSAHTKLEKSTLLARRKMRNESHSFFNLT